MAYACDVQLLRGPDGRYVIKEFALFETNMQRDEFKIANFAPPCPEIALPPCFVTQNNYVTQKIHGLTWDSGVSPYESLEDTLRQFTEFVTDQTPSVHALPAPPPFHLLNSLNANDRLNVSENIALMSVTLIVANLFFRYEIASSQSTNDRYRCRRWQRAPDWDWDRAGRRNRNS